MTAIRQDFADKMTVAVIAKRYGIPGTKLRDNFERAGMGIQ